MKFLKGFYKAEKNWFDLLQVQEDGSAFHEDGNGVIFNFVFNYGDFGEAIDEIKEKTGIDNYNVEMKMLWNEQLGDGFKEWVLAFSELGIITENGEKCVSKSAGGMGVVELQKISEEEANIIINDYDPIEAPPGSYKIQPEVPGKEWASQLQLRSWRERMNTFIMRLNRDRNRSYGKEKVEPIPKLDNYQLSK